MTKLANIRCALVLTVAALTAITLIATNGANAADNRSVANATISGAPKKAAPTQNIQVGVNAAATGGNKSLPVRNPVTLPTNGGGKQLPVTGTATPVTVPFKGGGKVVKEIGKGLPPVAHPKPFPKPPITVADKPILKPVTLAMHGNDHMPIKTIMTKEIHAQMLKMHGHPHHKYGFSYINWYAGNGGHHYVDLNYTTDWSFYASYPVVYVVEKAVEVCETEYKYRLRYVPGHGYQRVIVTVCKLV